MIKKQGLKNYLYGMKRAIPVLIGFLPVAITYAIMATGIGLAPWETVGMSAAVFAGASQIMATGMLAGGAGYLSIWISTLVLNLRHVIMSTCVFRRMRCKSKLLRALSGFGVTDETFALFTTEQDEERCDLWFMLGLITVAYLSWVLGAAVGIVASNLLPPSISQSFGIALYALFVALLVPGVKKDIRLLVMVAVTVLLNCVLGLWMDDSWAIICATLLGAGFGVWLTECRPFGTDNDTKSSGREEGASA